MASPDYLFSEIPSLEIVNEWLEILKIRQGHVFSEEGFNWIGFDRVLLEVEPYYYNCKAKKYLHREHTINTALTVLRQLVKPHGLMFRTHERFIHRKKHYEYYLVPDLSKLPTKPENNLISFN